MRSIKSAILCSFFAAIICTEVAAQANPNTDIGIRAYGSYDGFGIDTVDLLSRNLIIKIPTASYPQRGNLKANQHLIFNSKQWRVSEHCIYSTCTSSWLYKAGGDGSITGWVLDAGFKVLTPPAVDPQNFYIYSIADASGGTHVLSRGTSDPAHSGNTLYYALDGSGYAMSAKRTKTSDPTGGVVYVFQNNGNNLPGNGVYIEDSNGNKITTTTGVALIDSAGRTLPNAVTDTTYDVTGCRGPLPVANTYVFAFPGMNDGTNSGQVKVKTCEVNIPLKTAFNATDENGILIKEYQGSINFIQSFIVYDGTSWTTSPQWTFQYANNPDGTNYGDMTQVTLPTGGTLNYTWETVGWFDTACGGVMAPSHTPSSRAVVTRSQDAADGSGAQTWNYKAPATVNNQWGTAVGVSDPMGNEVVHYFSEPGSGSGCDLRESYTLYFTGMQSTGTLQKTIQTTYRKNVTTIQDPMGSGTTLAIFPSVITTTLPNNKVTQVQRDYVDADGVTGTVQAYDHLFGTTYSIPVGNLIEERVYNYGSGAPGPLIKKTHYTYKAWPSSGNAYMNLNMLDRVASVTVYDGSGTELAQTTYGYDEYPVQPSGVSSNLDTTIGTYRGNQTSVSQWVSNTASNLVSTTKYYNTGMPYQSIDPNSNVTTYSYDSTGLYVTQTKMPDTGSIHHVVSAAYDFNTGQVTSFVDQNSKASSYSYDALGRIKIATLPDGGGTNFYYPDLVTVERTKKIDSTRTTDEYFKFDGLGRPIRTAKQNGQSPAYDQADTCYNGDSTVRFKSYPYQGSGFSTGRVCSGAGDTYAYDGMQRVTTVTHSDGTTVQNQYTSGGLSTAAVLTRDEGNGSTQVSRVSQSDALGRLISVCEVSATTQLGLGATPGSCSQDIAATGFLTSYTYDALGNLKTVSQGGNLNRSFVYDGLSRLTSATNPEAGTTTYAYDSNSACAAPYTFKGDLVSKTDARGIRTCYRYDALHRSTYKSYSDGTTPAATFNYDEATVAGHATTNPIGHMTSETTSNTGMYFWSFDAMGRPQGMSQCTPRTCGSSYYNSSFGYDLLGDTISAVLPSNGPTLTYTYNTAARLASVASSLSDTNHPGMLLSSISYGPFGLTSEQVGNLATEQMTYNPRGWVSTIAATGVSSTGSSGSITVSGTEQNRTQSSATPGQGTVTISNSERSTQVLTQGATHSTGSVTITGSEQVIDPGDCPNHRPCLYDYGTCTVTIVGIPANYNYQQGSTTTSIATGLKNAINAYAPLNTYVSATSSGNTVSLTSIGTGASTNYSIAVPPINCAYDSADGFPHPSFVATPTGMSGGLDAVYTTVYDTGTVGITVNGYNKTVSYGQSSTSTTIASALASAFYNDGSAPVYGTSSGAVVTLTSRASGAGTNYSLTASSATNNGYFTGTSFPASPSGGNLTGGTDATIQYDTGTVTATINSTQSTTTYGQGDSSSTVAAHLAAAINANSPVVNASSTGNVVNLTSKTNGVNTNYPVSATSASTAGFSPVSFTTAASGMTGGTGGSLYSVGLSYFNDGNINTSADSVNGNWVYTYDDLNRVKTAVASARGIGCSWAYDRFGNRWQQNNYSGTCLTPSYTSTGGNNRIDGATYDAAGNYTSGGYVYDAENRLITAPGGYSYVYDAEGRRVAKKTSGTITNEYLLDASGGQLVELDGSGNVLHTNIFANGQLIATYKNDNQTYFHFNDWLGNRRFQTNAAGDAPHTLTCTNYPFGDALSCTGSGVDATEHHFTGKERDAENGLDYFGARYYGSNVGRFSSADPSGLYFANPQNPQSLNLYAYVMKIL